MFNYFTLFIIIILLIFLTIIIIRKINESDIIESYGEFCGRYDTFARCNNDNECIWNDYIAQDKTSHGWCGQNPTPGSRKNKNIS